MHVLLNNSPYINGLNQHCIYWTPRVWLRLYLLDTYCLATSIHGFVITLKYLYWLLVIEHIYIQFRFHFEPDLFLLWEADDSDT